MLRLNLLACFTFFYFCIRAQPYVDLLTSRYTYAFKTKDNKGVPFQHFYIGSDVPIKLKNNGLIVFSPFFDHWNIDSSDNKNFLPGVSSIALPVIMQVPLQNKNWSITLAAISRFNSEGLMINGSTFQIGGLATINYRYKQTLKYRLGIYANKEQFGLFIVPLAGIDWKIDSRNYLFGLLPGRLTYEHKISDHFYTGATFRAITTSYLLKNDHYLRIDDNQLSCFIDCYVTKKIVITGETGYSIRKLREGSGRNKNYITDYNWEDGLFIKLSASYRLRL